MSNTGLKEAVDRERSHRTGAQGAPVACHNFLENSEFVVLEFVVSAELGPPMRRLFESEWKVEYSERKT